MRSRLGGLSTGGVCGSPTWTRLQAVVGAEARAVRAVRERCARRVRLDAAPGGGGRGGAGCASGSRAVCAEARFARPAHIDRVPLTNCKIAPFHAPIRRPPVIKVPHFDAVSRKSAGHLGHARGPPGDGGDGFAAGDAQNAARYHGNQHDSREVPLGFPVLVGRSVGDSRTGALRMARRGSPIISS